MVALVNCRSSVENVSTDQVAESAAATATVSPCSLHYTVAGGLSVSHTRPYHRVSAGRYNGLANPAGCVFDCLCIWVQ